MTVALSRPGHGSQPRLILSPTMFRPPPNYIPYNNEKRYSLANKMEETLSFPSGVGADCVLKVPNSTLRHRFNFETSKRTLRTLFDPLCAKQVSRTHSVNFDIEKAVYEGYTNYSGSTVSRDLGGPKCQCSRDMVHYLCDPGVEGNPEAFTTVTRDTVLNVTGRNISEYLMFTTNRFKRHR